MTQEPNLDVCCYCLTPFADDWNPQIEDQHLPRSGYYCGHMSCGFNANGDPISERYPCKICPKENQITREEASQQSWEELQRRTTN